MFSPIILSTFLLNLMKIFHLKFTFHSQKLKKLLRPMSSDLVSMFFTPREKFSSLSHPRWIFSPEIFYSNTLDMRSEQIQQNFYKTSHEKWKIKTIAHTAWIFLTFSIILMLEYFNMSMVWSANSFSSKLCCDWMRLEKKKKKSWKRRNMNKTYYYAICRKWKSV